MIADPASGFALMLCDSQRNERFDQVAQFIGADRSGAFGILPHHADFVAVLRYGLARFADSAGRWHYLALPGGVLHFTGNKLTLATVRYFLGEQRESIVTRLAEEMSREESDLHKARAMLDEIERTLIRRLGVLSSQMQGTLRP